MAGEGKVRKGFYIEEDLLEQIDGLLEQADVKSRNEFLNQALKFYIGYLTSEKIENYMLSTISSVMHSTVKDSENRMARVMYKLAVETSKLSHVIAYSHLPTPRPATTSSPVSPSGRILFSLSTT